MVSVLCFLEGLGDISWLAWCVPWGNANVVLEHWGTYYDERSVWTWAMYEAPPVLNLNLRGLFSRTDLMSLAAAGAEPDIVEFVWVAREERPV